MFISLWVLVLLLDPEEFNEHARTPQNMEIMLSAFVQKADCETAARAMGKEAQINFRPHHYFCDYTEVFAYQPDTRPRYGEDARGRWRAYP